MLSLSIAADNLFARVILVLSEAMPSLSSGNSPVKGRAIFLCVMVGVVRVSKRYTLP